MAILDDYRGIAAEVLIEAEPALEYDNLDDVVIIHPDPAVARYQASRTVSKYIQSETEQKFSIRFKVGAPYIRNHVMDHVKLGFHVQVDGKPVGTIWLSRTWFRREVVATVWEEELKGVKIGKGRSCTMREFKFVKIDTNETDCEPAALKRLTQQMKAVGKIEIRVFNETAGKKGGDLLVTTEGFMDRNGADVSERAVKGDVKSHGTSLSRPSKVSRGPVFRTKYKDGIDYPLVIFQFLYRNQDALKHLGVINRAQSASLTRSPSLSPPTSPLREPNSSQSSSFTPSQQTLITQLYNKLKKERAAGSRASRGVGVPGSSSASRNRNYDHRDLTRVKRERAEDDREKKKVARREKTLREARERKPGVQFEDLTGGDSDEGEATEDSPTMDERAEDDHAPVAQDNLTRDTEDDQMKDEEEIGDH